MVKTDNQILAKLKNLESTIFRDNVIRNLRNLYPFQLPPGYTDDEYKAIIQFFMGDQFEDKIKAEDKNIRYLTAFVLGGSNNPSREAQLMTAETTDRLFKKLGVYQVVPPNGSNDNVKKKSGKRSDGKMGGKPAKEIKLPQRVYEALVVVKKLPLDSFLLHNL